VTEIDYPAARTTFDTTHQDGEVSPLDFRVGSRAAVAATLAARPVYPRYLPTYRVAKLVTGQLRTNAAIQP
jgi:hypothetical protein